MGELDPAKIIMILLVAVLVLGPERLPRAARQMGAMWRELGRIRERVENEVRDALPDLDLPKIPVLPRHGITGYLAGMMTSSPSPTAHEESLAETIIDPEEAAAYPSGSWVSSADEVAVAGAVPAGWNAVGAPAPGYASGSLLTAVPAVGAAGPLAAEGELSFDEPGWN
ncbi:MAG: Sec-independent protein translocase subunit TatA/TatB [Acidimicrobiales bacterium]